MPVNEQPHDIFTLEAGAFSTAGRLDVSTEIHKKALSDFIKRLPVKGHTFLGPEGTNFGESHQVTGITHLEKDRYAVTIKLNTGLPGGKAAERVLVPEIRARLQECATFKADKGVITCYQIETFNIMSDNRL
jgi:hypothetical protein